MVWGMVFAYLTLMTLYLVKHLRIMLTIFGKCFGGYVNMGLNLNPKSADSSSEKLTILDGLCQQQATDYTLLVMKYFSFVSRCSHFRCGSRRFDCILLVFFRRWSRLVTRYLMKHDVLLWLVGFQQLWLAHFDPRGFGELFPRRSVVVRLSCCCVSWSWASMLLEFLFHCPCWCC